MNLIPIMKEIGIFDTLITIEKFKNDNTMLTNAKTYIPICVEEEAHRLADAKANFLKTLNKKNLLLLTPEKALIERLALIGYSGRVIIALPLDIEPESEERIARNIPPGIKIELIKEGTFPQNFGFVHDAIIAVGFASGNYQKILKYNHRMMSLYQPSFFYGERILLSCSEEGVASANPYYWASAEPQFFSNIA